MRCSGIHLELRVILSLQVGGATYQMEWPSATDSTDFEQVGFLQYHAVIGPALNSV
jgi:hypothetical protein